MIDIKQAVDLGSHTLFIGEPTAMEIISDAPSATYAYYQSNIKPKPESAGTANSGQAVCVARSAVMNMWEKNSRRILSVRSASIRRVILRRLRNNSG